jgi:aminoglycoside phosphotransferase (APT) family kinase protein
MRERWPRFRPEIELDRASLTHLVRRALPGAVVNGQAAVGGGRANTNIRVDLLGAPSRVLLRVYQRDPAQAAKEAWWDMRLRAAGVPTAAFLGLVEADERTGLTCAVLEWIAGERLDLVVPGGRDKELGAAAGEVLARVHGIAPGPAGFLSPDTRPATAITFTPEAMAAYIGARIVEGPGAARLGPALTGRLMAFVTGPGARLATWPGPGGLVHGDCNASNFVMRDGRVAALLDWEFAFSGAPVFDLGNLLRPPIGGCGGFVAGLGEGYRAAGGDLPANWRALAWLADLYAWADFLGRAVIAPEVIEDARRMVAETLDYFAVVARDDGS